MYTPQQLMQSVSVSTQKEARHPYIGLGTHQLALCSLILKQTDSGPIVFLTAAVLKSECHPVGSLVTGSFPVSGQGWQVENELGRMNALVAACCGQTDAATVAQRGTEMLSGTFGRGYQFTAIGIDAYANKPQAGKTFIKPNFAPVDASLNTPAALAQILPWLDAIPGSIGDYSAQALPAAPAAPQLPAPAAPQYAAPQPAPAAAPAPMLPPQQQYAAPQPAPAPAAAPQLQPAPMLPPQPQAAAPMLPPQPAPAAAPQPAPAGTGLPFAV